jgi:ATP-dependent exoDNAse (exonuclease V) beta subunit
MNNNQALLQDDDYARTAALDITRSFIVQAPAGSGKTELLIQRYLKLLGVVSAPEEILAITFTRKAAAEMQIRVLKALQAAADRTKPDAPHERITAQAATTALERDRDLGWNLLQNPRRLRIQTLDSLNASIARAQPLTAAGGAADTAIIADTEMRTLYRDAAALTLDQLAEDGDLREATREVLVHVDTNAFLYIAYLARMLATRDQWLPFVGSGLISATESDALRNQFEEGLEYVVGRHLEDLQGAVPQVLADDLLELGRYAAANLQADGNTGSTIIRLAEITKLPDGTSDAAATWSGIAELLLTQQGDFRKRINKNQGFPPGDDGQKNSFGDIVESLQDSAEFRDLLHQVRELPPVTYSDDQWSVLLALFRLLPLAVTELKRLFAERSVTDHIEVALSASDALGTPEAPGDVTLLLDYQIRHLLVDEMQDTSSAQYRMIEALTGGWESEDGRTLYCVGDPMQSIYRFRNAEVGQFLLAKESGIGSVDLETLVLRRNFRSGQALVDWYNRAFPTVLPPRDNPQLSAVSYAAAISVPNLAGQGECVVHPVYGSDAGIEADAGLDVIRQTLNANKGDNMAVLVRGRSHLPELLYRLRNAGIPYRAIEIDRLTDLPEVIDVLALTRALVHHGDRHAWLALLRAPWAGLDWCDLHALVMGNAKATVWELVSDTGALARLSDIGRTAAQCLRDTLAPSVSSCRVESLRDRVERAWLALGGPAILENDHAVDNVYHFLDVVENLEVAGDLPDVAELEAMLDAEHVSSNVNAELQVMTMHRAKGLQFDHVMLFGLGRIPRPRDSGVLSWFDIPDEHGRTRKVISPVGPRAELEKNPMHSYIGKVESQKDRSELGRLLYVACTRARKSLHLMGNARLLKSGMRPDRRSLLHLLWPIVGQEYEQSFDAELHVENGAQSGEWLLPTLRRFENGWSPPDVPRLPVESQAVDEGGTAVEFYWVGSGARIAGTLVHRWAQLAADGRVSLQDITVDMISNAGTRWLREIGVTGEAGEAIIQRATAALHSMAEDDKGQWLIDGDGHAELALSGVVNGQLESVVLDRVRIDDDGTHWIVDYKTSSHEGGDLQGFLGAETDRYRPQLAKYAEIYRNYSNADVRCALYFPLLQEFVEVKL